MKTIYFAGGCFWGTQKYFDQFDGVTRTEVGYANGPAVAPSYEDVCAGSGHAETVLVEFDESVISLEQLIKYYFMVIDPTSVNRQGHDVGIQYRTGIYYSDPAMLETIKKAYDEEEALRRLLPFKLKDQYAFKTEKALSLLQFRRKVFV